MSTLFAVAMGLLALAPLTAAWTSQGAAATGAAGCGLLVVVGLTAALGGSHPAISFGDWLGFGDSALRADGLAGIFLALTGITGAATALAAFELPPPRWVTALGSTIVLAAAVAIEADNAFLFFLAWEMLTVCIYLIASGDRERPDELLQGYFTAGLTKLGGAALLAAFALLYGHTHSFSLAVWAHSPLSGATRGVLFTLFLVAFGTKVGIAPVQGALPSGYGAAPRLGAAWLSVALGAGYYGLWRFVFDTIGPLPTWCGDATLIVGAMTAVLGIAYAITQDNLRRFLGYSTVEHAGIVVLGFGVALLGQGVHNRDLAAAGLLAASLHVCAHNLAKTLALIGIDRVESDTGQRTIDPLGGVGRRLPVGSAALGAASLTLAAVPPLGGFVSEWFTFEALLQGFRMPTLLSRLLCALAAAALAFTAGLGLLAFAKYYGFIFLGPARAKLPPVTRRASSSLSLVALGVLVMFLGTAAPWEIHALGSGMTAALGFDPADAVISHPLVLGPVFANFSVLAPTWLMIVIPAYATLAFLIGWSQRRRPPRRAAVWVTGNLAELAAVQYRPSAYSNPMRVILRGPLGYRSRLVAPDAADADQRSALQRTVVSAVDRFLYTPVATAALAVAARTRRLQSGHLSMYLLYMLVALILALTLIPVLH
jgi:hydrogenase-4 component B